MTTSTLPFESYEFGTPWHHSLQDRLKVHYALKTTEADSLISYALTELCVEDWELDEDGESLDEVLGRLSEECFDVAGKAFNDGDLFRLHNNYLSDCSDAEYTFDRYHRDTDFTRNGPDIKHNTTAYALLGLIGELGEIAAGLDREAFTKTQASIESEEFIKLIAQFVVLSKQVEAFKKYIRKEQVVLFPGIAIDNLSEELGGVYWYLNNLANLNSLGMTDVARTNQQLLKRRFDTNPGWMANDGPKEH